MKLVFTIKALNGIAGGAERVFCVVTSALAECGHDVTIVSFDHNKISPYYPLSPLVKTKALGHSDPRHKSTLVEIVKRIKTLRGFIRQERPDIAIGFMHSIFVPLAFSLIGTNIPVIASEHIVPQYYSKRRLEFLAIIFSGFFTRGITVLSQNVMELYPSILRRKMIIAPNPVSRFPSASVSGKKKIVLNIARLDPQKDQKTLIAAFAQISPKYPDWVLRIVGEGPLRPELENQIQTSAMQNKIFLAGKNPAVENEYSQAEIFVIPSLYESFGLATAEALSFKLPVIGFKDCPGTNEIVIDGVNGILAEPVPRVASLAAALETLISSEDYRRELGARGPETISKYQPEAIAIIWEGILSQAL